MYRYGAPGPDSVIAERRSKRPLVRSTAEGEGASGEGLARCVKGVKGVKTSKGVKKWLEGRPCWRPPRSCTRHPTWHPGCGRALDSLSCCVAACPPSCFVGRAGQCRELNETGWTLRPMIGSKTTEA